MNDKIRELEAKLALRDKQLDGDVNHASTP